MTDTAYSCDDSAGTWKRWGMTPPQRVALVAFLFSGAVTSALLVMPFFLLNQMGRGATLSGIFIGVEALGYTLASLFSARFVARARHGLNWSLFGVTGFLIFLSAMPAFRTPLLCGFCFVGAFTFSAFAWPAFHSWVGAEPIPEARARHMSLVNVAWSTGGAAGPLLAGPFYEMDYRLPFVFIAALCLLSLLLIASIPMEKHYFARISKESATVRAAHDRASESFLYSAWCATFAAHITVGSTRAVFPKQLDELINEGLLRFLWEGQASAWLNSASATRFSWLAVIMGLATGLVFFIMGRSAWWHHRFSMLVIIQLLTGAAMWSLGCTHSMIIMLIAFSVIGVNLGVAFFSSVFYGMANPTTKHGRAAINEGVVGLGGMVGSLGFAALGVYAGLNLPFRLMPIVMVVIVLIQWSLIRWKRVKNS
ncbi:MAG: MFS transporter [Candidatus Hydrogenedens sp.]|jgi:MFS family permease|nr:MFS transporter [Candidatus Hydrogenedens sp.]